MHMSRAELVAASNEITGGNLEKFSSEQLQRLITISQHVQIDPAMKLATLQSPY